MAEVLVLVAVFLFAAARQRFWIVPSLGIRSLVALEAFRPMEMAPTEEVAVPISTTWLGLFCQL